MVLWQAYLDNSKKINVKKLEKVSKNLNISATKTNYSL